MPQPASLPQWLYFEQLNGEFHFWCHVHVAFALNMEHKPRQCVLPSWEQTKCWEPNPNGCVCWVRGICVSSPWWYEGHMTGCNCLHSDQSGVNNDGGLRSLLSPSGVPCSCIPTHVQRSGDSGYWRAQAIPVTAGLHSRTDGKRKAHTRRGAAGRWR